MAPRKFSTPAMAMACSGVRPRVATTVAIALAVSWKPLMKSNTTASTITAMSIAKPPSNGLGVLDDDAVQDVGDVLGSVGRLLEKPVGLFPADQVEELVGPLDQGGQPG